MPARDPGLGHARTKLRSSMGTAMSPNGPAAVPLLLLALRAERRRSRKLIKMLID